MNAWFQEVTREALAHRVFCLIVPSVLAMIPIATICLTLTMCVSPWANSKDHSFLRFPESLVPSNIEYVQGRVAEAKGPG